MATTQWGAVVDALVTTMRGTSGYRSPYSAASAIPVFDGPEYALTDELFPTLLVIGWSGEPGQWEESGSSRQDPGPMAPAARPRNEEGVIRCRAAAQTGDASLSDRSIKDVRDAALAVIADMETALRADPTLGLVPTLTYLEIGMGEVTPRQYVKAGAVCEIDFQVTYKVRI